MSKSIERSFYDVSDGRGGSAMSIEDVMNQRLRDEIAKLERSEAINVPSSRISENFTDIDSVSTRTECIKGHTFKISMMRHRHDRHFVVYAFGQTWCFKHHNEVNEFLAMFR